ncbi:MAG: hypothetical protein HRT89_20580, partial [Lentisphaeria bacterium]|nr:hypothetical protein [Lentisphaeria bacterium]
EDINDDAPQSDDDMETEEYMDVQPNNSPLTISGIMGGRTAAGRAGAVKKHGGSGKGQQAVNKALKWLASVQEENGSWESRPAHTGMALLVFLAHGETPLSETYGKTVRTAIKWLHEYASGSKMMKSRAYSHGIATYAIAEAYGMTQIPFLKTDMEKCIQRIIDGQQEGGGFDYNYAKGARWDLSVCGWQFQALKASFVSGASNPGLQEAIYKSIKFLKNTTYKGYKFGYSSAGSGGNMTGVGTVALQLLGASKSEEAQGGCRTIEEERLNLYRKVLKAPDTFAGVAAGATYGWYYDTQAMFNTGGGTWKRWRKIFEPVLIKAQDPAGYWETTGGPGMGPTLPGRILSTCWTVLQLEVYYRYLPTFDIGKMDRHAAGGGGDIEDEKDGGVVIEIE